MSTPESPTQVKSLTPLTETRRLSTRERMGERQTNKGLHHFSSIFPSAFVKTRKDPSIRARNTRELHITQKRRPGRIDWSLHFELWNSGWLWVSLSVSLEKGRDAKPQKRTATIVSCPSFIAFWQTRKGFKERELSSSVFGRLIATKRTFPPSTKN